jgi:hypothetical protein
MHQNAIAGGAVEPKGNGAAVTVTNSKMDAIRLDGVSIASSYFIQRLGELLRGNTAESFDECTSIDQIAIKRNEKLPTAALKSFYANSADNQGQ